ncbi:hypothetical protein EYF80_014932 [Liparis tanakae]|uniref:Uncharacterized protein n=1 Tax=Liparis tanakae TaxID=230148 RepID=A0A4Z2IBP5_9TELE|nr:hypothetical protein EYF80_014932 [Liparis tanakae]
MSVHTQTDTWRGGGMCRGDGQGMMRSDISREISEHKQRNTPKAIGDGVIYPQWQEVCDSTCRLQQHSGPARAAEDRDLSDVLQLSAGRKDLWFLSLRHRKRCKMEKTGPVGFDCSLCCGVRNQQTGVGGGGGGRPIPLKELAEACGTYPVSNSARGK